MVAWFLSVAEKLLNSEGRELRRMLFSLKQIFQVSLLFLFFSKIIISKILPNKLKQKIKKISKQKIIFSKLINPHTMYKSFYIINTVFCFHVHIHTRYNNKALNVYATIFILYKRIYKRKSSTRKLHSQRRRYTIIYV